jgi:hypothetical protein
MTLTTPPKPGRIGLVSAGLHLRFLDEIERQTVAEGSEHDRCDLERAIGRRS